MTSVTSLITSMTRRSMPQLNERGLSISNDGEAGSFRFIHLQGAHFPYTMNAQAEHVDGETTYDQQALGAFKIVSTYLNDLKELGVMTTPRSL